MAHSIGLTLALLPLVTSAIQLYASVAAAVHRHRRGVPGARDFLRLLNVQRVVFRNATKSLLVSCVGEEAATRMLSDSQDMLWNEQFIQDSLQRKLDISYDAVVDLFLLIRSELNYLEAEMRRLENAACREANVRFLLAKFPLADSYAYRM